MRNVASLLSNYTDLSSLLSLCGREKHRLLGSSIHASIIKNATHFCFESEGTSRNVTVLCNSLISMYAKCGQLRDAAKVFDEMPLKDTISWNSIISGCFIQESFPEGFGYFKRMRSLTTTRLDGATLTTLISICTEPEHLYACSMLHSLAVSSGFDSVVQVGNALVTAYFKCDSPLSSKMVFDGMNNRNVITWTAMISGLAQTQQCRESLILFREMLEVEKANSVTYASLLLACSGLRAIREGQQIHGLIEKLGLLSDLHVKSALTDMYSKCGIIAHQIFHSCDEPDEVFLTVMLVSFAQNGMEEKAFDIFVELVGRGTEVDENMVSAILGAFDVYTSFALALGKQIHSLVVKKCMGCNVYVCNGLINMYSKCGELKDSIGLFNLTPYKNSVSWNSIIAAFARHGRLSEALQHYHRMTLDGIEPTDITYLSLLHACSHVGAIEKGVELLSTMSAAQGMTPRAEHYACIVDMLGRGGQLHEARSFTEGLDVEPSSLLWQALLGACCIHGNMEMGRYAAEKLVILAPECHSAYVLLANIYSTDGRWEDRARIIKKMKEKGVKKQTGVSWIEIEKEIHSFVVDDELHPEAHDVYEILTELMAHIKDDERFTDECSIS
ncbi:Pentatricopeptide repeat-containing protein [Apostasia shenzhenica]|uniref:Pentatricopeptide repeat-containing protein n=1 Tax=Apostasia shenzhenica TaxID=1088818 RepID=A0A2I0B362_9ASPA|nr:Pentatricopeptide repeat-containing protein [Apostasia shenzhenica]